MKNTLGLNGCEICGERILYGIMERDGIGKVQVRSQAIHRLVVRIQVPNKPIYPLIPCAMNCATTNGITFEKAHILMGKDGIGKVQVRSKAIYRLVVRIQEGKILDTFPKTS